MRAFAIGVVTIKSLACFPPEASALDDSLKCSGRRHPIPKRVRQNRARLAGDVQPDLVQQRESANGKPKIRHRRVDGFDARAIIQQFSAFVEIGRQNAIYIESWSIAHDDDCFAKFPTVFNCRYGGFRTCGWRHDDFQQRHLVHGRKEMHADHAVRMRRD